MSSIFNRFNSLVMGAPTDFLDSSSPPQSQPKKLEPRWTLLPAQTEEQKFAHFNAELDETLKSLDSAVEKNTRIRGEIGDLQADLQNRSWVDSLKANFNGQTDKELAKSIEALAGSVEVTQKAVRLILQIQTQKGRILHIFSDALAAKIINIQDDTHTLDKNQRAAALVFLEELRQQVQEQIHQQELIDQHEQNLIDILQWKSKKEELDCEEMKRLDNIKKEIEAIKPIIIEVSQWNQELRAQLAQAEQRSLQKFEQLTDVIENTILNQTNQRSKTQKISDLVETLNNRLEQVELANSRSKSFTKTLLRHSLTLIALIIATMALIKIS